MKINWSKTSERDYNPTSEPTGLPQRI